MTSSIYACGMTCHYYRTKRCASSLILSLGFTSPAIHRLFHASVDAPRRSTPPSDGSNCLQHYDGDEPPPLKRHRVLLSTGEKHNDSQLAIAPLGDGRLQQKIIPYPLVVVQGNIPVNLQKALKCLVIGHYTEVFRSVYSHLAKLIRQYTSTTSETSFADGDGVAFEFGLGTVQHLPIQALNHPALVHSDDYESILQLIMEAILMAPHPKENLDKFLRYPNLQVPESLQLLYRSRLPSVATDKELQDQLVSRSHHLADSLRGEQQQTNFAASRNRLYLAHVYDATAYINKHVMRADFRSMLMQKADFHWRAVEERQNYEPRTDLEKAILKLESAHSAQSQGYAYAALASNGPDRPVVRRKHAEKAREIHEEAINEHAIPLLETLYMHKGMSEGAAFVASLRFDEMVRNLRPAQLDYILHHGEWSEEERQRKLQNHLKLVVNEFDRIRDQLSSRIEVVPVLKDLLAKMEESMVPLKEDVANGRIKGFALNDPTVSE